MLDDWDAPFFDYGELDMAERVQCKSCGTDWVYCEEHDEWLGDRRGFHTLNGLSPVHGKFCPDCWHINAGYNDLKRSISETDEDRLVSGLERVIKDVLFGKQVDAKFDIPATVDHGAELNASTVRWNLLEAIMNAAYDECDVKESLGNEFSKEFIKEEWQ